MIDITPLLDNYTEYLKSEKSPIRVGVVDVLELKNLCVYEFETLDGLLKSMDDLLNHAYLGTVPKPHLGICGNLSFQYKHSWSLISKWVGMVAITMETFSGNLSYPVGRLSWDKESDTGRERIELLECMRDCVAHYIEHGTLGRDPYVHPVDSLVLWDHGHLTVMGKKYINLRAARRAYTAWLEEQQTSGL